LSNDNPDCQICPQNSYSLGGSFRVSGDQKEWNEHTLKVFGNSCSYLEDKKWVDNKNCKAFSINEGGRSISAGSETGMQNTINFFELTYGLHFKKPGNVIL